MTWHELPPLATDVAAQLPTLPQIALVAGRIGDYAHALATEERPALGRAVEKRVREFATGRYLARLAMADLGAAPCAIPRAEDRRPLWPGDLVGSITHAGDVAVAGVASARALLGLGVDLEDAMRVTDNLFSKLFTAAELAGFASADPRLPGLLFSAKEATYKAVNPSVGKFIGFQEVEVDVDWPERTFRLRYVGDHGPNGIMEAGSGHFCFFEGYVLTVFMIPR